MELFMAIAMLCNAQIGMNGYHPAKAALDCQQQLLHCVNIKEITTSQTNALNRCIMERSL